MNKTAATPPIYIVKEYKFSISAFVKSLFWTIAGRSPFPVINEIKPIKTVAIATIAKSAGSNIRDRIAVTTNETIRLRYFAIAV